jgi:hypothetical protein
LGLKYFHLPSLSKLFNPSPSSDEVNDEDVADNEAAEREEIDKDKEREMINHVESIGIHAIEEVKGLVPLHHQLGVALNDHVGGALVKLCVRMFSLPEHEGLGG